MLRKRQFMMMALVSSLGVAVATAQGYQGAEAKKEMTFSGTVESVNLQDHSFIVRNDQNKNKVQEMKFRFAPSGVPLVEEGETVPISELRKGEQVTVTWKPENVMHMVRNVQSHKGAMLEHGMQSEKPFTFTGKVESVNPKDQTFVVRHEANGKVEELKFHLAPGTKLTLNGTPVLLSQLERDDQVTVSYETVHTLSSVRRSKAS